MNFDEAMLGKIIKKVRTGTGDAAIQQGYFQDKISFPADVKHTFARDGAVLIVHDVPITKVGIQPYYDQQGNLQRHLKTPEAVAGIKSDFAPMSFSHPAEHFRQMDDEQVKTLTVGWTSDGRYDPVKKKRYADLYFNVKKLQADKRGLELLERIKAGKSTDVSIGFFVEIDQTPGEFDGKAYDAKQIGIDYDHLAILVDEQGRYSFPDAVGIGADGLENQIDNGGKRMGTEQNTTPAAADVLAGQLREAEKARQEADARAKQAVEDAEKSQKELEAFKTADAKRAADEHIKRVDAFVKRLQEKSLDKTADKEKWGGFLNGLSADQMTFIEGVFGDSMIVKDNKIHFVAQTSSNDSSGSSKDHFQTARDKAYADWKVQNGLKA